MSQNLLWDPIARDYIVVNGSPVPDDSIYPRAYFAIKIPRNQGVYPDVATGSDVYLLSNTKRTNQTDALYIARSNKAIQTQLIANGYATQVQTSNLADSRNGTSNQINIQPSQQAVSSVLSFAPV